MKRDWVDDNSDDDDSPKDQPAKKNGRREDFTEQPTPAFSAAELLNKQRRIVILEKGKQGSILVATEIKARIECLQNLTDIKQEVQTDNEADDEGNETVKTLKEKVRALQEQLDKAADTRIQDRTKLTVVLKQLEETRKAALSKSELHKRIGDMTNKLDDAGSHERKQHKTISDLARKLTEACGREKKLKKDVIDLKYELADAKSRERAHVEKIAEQTRMLEQYEARQRQQLELLRMPILVKQVPLATKEVFKQVEAPKQPSPAAAQQQSAKVPPKKAVPAQPPTPPVAEPEQKKNQIPEVPPKKQKQVQTSKPPQKNPFPDALQKKEKEEQSPEPPVAEHQHQQLPQTSSRRVIKQVQPPRRLLAKQQQQQSAKVHPMTNEMPESPSMPPFLAKQYQPRQMPNILAKRLPKLIAQSSKPPSAAAEPRRLSEGSPQKEEVVPPPEPPVGAQQQQRLPGALPKKEMPQVQRPEPPVGAQQQQRLPGAPPKKMMPPRLKPLATPAYLSPSPMDLSKKVIKVKPPMPPLTRQRGLSPTKLTKGVIQIRNPLSAPFATPVRISPVVFQATNIHRDYAQTRQIHIQAPPNIFEVHYAEGPDSLPYRPSATALFNLASEVREAFIRDDSYFPYKLRETYEEVFGDESLYCASCDKTFEYEQIFLHLYSKEHSRQVEYCRTGTAYVSSATFEHWKRKLEATMKAKPDWPTTPPLTPGRGSASVTDLVLSSCAIAAGLPAHAADEGGTSSEKNEDQKGDAEKEAEAVLVEKDGASVEEVEKRDGVEERMKAEEVNR